jgi:hypothetical protein
VLYNTCVVTQWPEIVALRRVRERLESKAINWSTSLRLNIPSTPRGATNITLGIQFSGDLTYDENKKEGEITIGSAAKTATQK